MYALAYAENDILYQDPVEITCLLYAKAIEKLNLAKQHLASENIDERSGAIAHAMEIVLELQGTLDGDKGGEIAVELARLYDYIQERLVEGNAQQSAAPLDEAIRLLSTLYDGWKQCRSQMMLEAVPTADITAADPAEADRAWTL